MVIIKPLFVDALKFPEAHNMHIADRDWVSTYTLSTRWRAKALKVGNFKPKRLSAHSLINVDAAPNISSVIFSSTSLP